MRLTIIAAFFAVAVAALAACDDTNDCESFASALCGYGSFTTDSDPGRAAQRKDDCTCFNSGPDAMDTDYKKLSCAARLGYLKALDPDVKDQAGVLDDCRAAHNMLDVYQDRYIQVCIQSGGTKDCNDSLDACQKSCTDACKDPCSTSGKQQECDACTTPCLGECARKYPCDNLCGAFDYQSFEPGGGGQQHECSTSDDCPGNKVCVYGSCVSGGSIDAGVAYPCEGAASGDDCTAGYCVEVTGNLMTCALACQAPGTQCNVGACYYLDTDKYVCLVSGNRHEGQTCSRLNDCDPGLQCLDDGSGGGMACFKVCNVDGDCTSPAVCSDTGLGFKVCKAP